MAHVTQARLEAACAWAARFVLEYGDLIGAWDRGEAVDGRVVMLARERLEWWKGVQGLGRSVSGFYDSVGTRDRLRALLRGEFDDEVDACIGVYGDEPHAVAVWSAWEQLCEKAKVA